MKKIFLVFIILYLIFLVLTRFYNVSQTARFTEDESGFMVRLHQIYVEKKITLVGQINDLGTKVFSSLSIYLLLPFAVIGKFNPASVFYGASFFGVLTVLAMLFLSRLINRSLFLLSAILLLVWFPLVQTGRWAWNPNFIPLWIALGIICYLKNKKILFLLSGIFFGLSVHQHYWAIFSISVFIFIASIELLIKRKIVNAILLNLGAGIMILPFIVFDLRHPPGIFILGASNQASQIKTGLIIQNIINYSQNLIGYFAQLNFLVIPLIILIIILTIIDIKKRSKALFFLIPSIFQIIMIAIVASYFVHYFFAVIVFFFAWLIYPRKYLGRIISILIIFIFITGSILKLKNEITVAPVEPSLPTVTKITEIIKNKIELNDLKNVNIAVIASPDMNTYGKKYRDILLINNVHIMTIDQYPLTDNLFVISTSSSSEILKDRAYEISSFRRGVVNETWNIDNNWNIYLLNKR